MSELETSNVELETEITVLKSKYDTQTNFLNEVKKDLSLKLDDIKRKV